MSNQVNDQLLERAAEMVEYWEGTLHARIIRHALDTNDLDEVRVAVADAEAEAARQEVYGYGLLPEREDVY
jgi:hypothetical protein